MINDKLYHYSLLISSPTVWHTDDSDGHKYADQEISQRHPPTKEYHIRHISTRDEMT